MNRNYRKGFTLMEVLIVLGILLVLGTLAVVAYPRIQESADKKSAKVLVDQVGSALDLYHTAMGTYPTTEEGLKALVTPPDDEKLKEKWTGGGGPFLKDAKIPTDPWGIELKYEQVQTGDSGAAPTGPAYHVWSMGPDKTDPTADDIKNWTEASPGSGG